MKIARSVRALFDECEPLYQRLSADVNERLKPRVEQRQWFFTSRVKQLESYALKLETGRVSDPRRPEDFFACTVVVPTLGQIDEAEKLVTDIYPMQTRRPPNAQKTSKLASSFLFDDLRLYVQQPESTTGRNTDLDGLSFEVQVKTILQYAWGVATHDLIYKSDQVSWPRERIAFQVKAMLEHSEIAIAEAERLADAPGVAKVDQLTEDTTAVLQELNATWTDDQLPQDRKRLADSILQVLRLCGKKAEHFPEIIASERNRLTVLPADLSPYAFTVQALANAGDVDLKARLAERRNRTSIFVHDNMELPAWMADPNPKIIRIS